MRIGVLTGGGDVPGLNPCIKALVYRAADAGHEVLGIRRGWTRLLQYNLDAAGNGQCVITLNKANTRTIDRTGGTFIHTSRANPGRVRRSEVLKFLQDPNHPPMENDPLADFTPHVIKVFEHLGLDALVTIGSDDTQSYAVRLHQEGIPGKGFQTRRY